MTRLRVILKKIFVKKWLIFIGFLVFLVLISLLFLSTKFHLPHKTPTIILPIKSENDANCQIIPMTENLVYLGKNGKTQKHSGIDFVFSSFGEDAPSFIAVMDGEISSLDIYNNPITVDGEKKPLSEQIVDITIRSGVFQAKYLGMDAATLPTNIKKGTKVKQGDILGWGGFFTDPIRPGMRVESMYFEFGANKLTRNHSCPLQYFTNDSLSRISQIWTLTNWQYKDQYPKICNDIYDQGFEK